MARQLRAMLLAGVVAVTVAGLAACAGGQPDPARSDGVFRHRWWHYYARALDAADRREYAAAVSDLGAALARDDRDRRMARTYGMHFIDYFPHRELGILFWLEGDLKAARTELERSIDDYPTAKARFYLDEVRKALIRERGEAAGPPELTLDMVGDLLRTRDDPVRIRGKVRDTNYVSALRIMGEPVYMEGASARFAFDHPLYLSQGRYGLTIAADNLAGRTCRRAVILVVDRSGPVVVVDRFTPGLIQGVVLDDAGVAEITVDGHPLAIKSAIAVPFEHRTGTAEKATTIVCRDRLGNATTARLIPGRHTAALRPEPRVAGLNLAGIFDATDDRQPPELTVAEWGDVSAVYMDKVLINGHVRDADKVVELTINDQPVELRPGGLVFFSRVVNLAPGDNTVVLQARDSRGHTVRRLLEIQRRIPAARLLAHRLRLTIFPFEQKGALSPSALAFQDSFIHQMVQPGRFQVVERDRLDTILQEHKISRSGLVDTRTAVRLGRLTAAQAIVAGSMVQTRTGTEIVGRVVDSETSEILATADIYSETGGLAGLRAMAQALSLKIHREFPLSEGVVVDKHGDEIFTDLGTDELRAQRRILVYTERPIVDPQSGQRLGVDHEILDTARVTQVQARLSKARLETNGGAVRLRHKVIPQ